MKKISPPIPHRLFSSLTLFFLCLSLFLSPVYAQSTAQNGDTTIDNGDLLYVIIPKEITSEFSPTERNFFKEKVEVDRHGYIFLPSQGNIMISGQTTAQISELLTNNLPKYLSKSDRASVNLIEKRHYIQILGHVNMPGWYNIPESANIQAILSQAGGTLEGADLSNVTISRDDSGTQRKIVANIQKYLLQGDTRILPPLRENDTVFVPLMTASEDIDGTKTVPNTLKIRIFGAVNTPGSFPVLKDKGINLLDLLITAQGETAEADLTRIQIMRVDGTKEIFNMQALLTTETPGETNSFPVIKGGDIVHIARQAIVATAGGNSVMAPQTITMTGPGSNSRGLRPFTPPMTPLEAISQGGGVNDFADTNDIFIIRRIDGKQHNLPYNYDKALKGEDPDVDFQLEPGDIIFIP